jgi:chromosome segregation ATPase
MERMEGLRKINSYEKYVEAKQRLEDYLKQYKWITEAKTPYEDIKNMLTKCLLFFVN